MLQNNYDLDMQQGVTFQLMVNVQDANTNPINLSGYNAVMQLRKNYQSNTITEHLSTANGEITLGSNAGVYLLTLSASRTANVAVDLCNGGYPPKTVYVYDMDITDPNGISTKIIWGRVNFYGEVSR